MPQVASTQINLPIYLGFLQSRSAQCIPKLALNSEAHEPDGIEHDAHITVLYGISPQAELEDIRAALYDITPFEITFGKLACFFGVEKGTADCVYCAIEPHQSLDLMRARMKKFLDPSIEMRPYIPHCTLAYVKLGVGQKYHGLDFECYLTGQKMLVDTIVFSSHDDRTKHEITLQPAHSWRNMLNPFNYSHRSFREYVVGSIPKL